jgi:hypothetical protein
MNKKKLEDLTSGTTNHEAGLVRPGDFPVGSLHSRAAARAVLQRRRNPQQEESDKIWDLCGQHVASFEAGPLLWLTKYTRTEDTHWLKKQTPPVAPFPKKEYFLHLIRLMFDEEALFIPKSREMMTSWLGCGLMAWMTQWLTKIQWIIQTEKEAKVVELVEYCRILYNRQDEWMKERNPLVIDNQTRLRRQNGSEIIGIPSGADQFRMYHPYGVLFDEAAFLSGFMRAYNTVKPVAKKIIAISSAGPGAFADLCQMAGEEDELPIE